MQRSQSLVVSSFQISTQGRQNIQALIEPALCSNVSWRRTVVGSLDFKKVCSLGDDLTMA